MKNLLFICATLLVGLCSGYVFDGTEDECTNMQPTVELNGARVLPQTTAAPFSVRTDQASYGPNTQIIVKIEATTTRPIVHYIIQARRIDPNENRDEQVGDFVIDDQVHEDICFSPFGSGIKNKAPMDAREIEVIWTAPSDFGNLQFLATIVTPDHVYWVRERSNILMNQDLILPSTTLPPIPSRPSIRFEVEKCGDENGCYRFPTGCKGAECDMLVMWRRGINSISFKLHGISDGWVAVGFSTDAKMGNDEVVECTLASPESRTGVVRQSYNDGKSNTVKESVNIGNEEIGFSSGAIQCAFTYRWLDSDDDDALTGSYHIFLAKGDVDERDVSRKLRHSLEPGKYPYVSPSRVELLNNVDISGNSRYALVKVHGIFMLIGWMICAFPAVLIAKYYKRMWPNKKLCGVPVWFAVHRLLQCINLLCTIIAFIVIFLHVMGYSSLPDLPGKAHPILGIIVTILCILNPLIALCRPSSKARCRPVFNWFHWFFGLVAIALATPALFIGLNLHKAFVPWWATWVMVVFMLFHLVVELLLEIHGCLNARKQQMRDEEFDIRKGPDARGKYEGLLPEPVGTRFKTNVLTVYGIVVGILGIIMIIAVIAG